MKKLILQTAVAAFFALTASTAMAKEFDEGIFHFSSISDTEVSVTLKIDETAPTTLVIPATVESDGKTFNVTQTGINAFLNQGTIETVTLPECLTVVGWASFQNCTNLKSINFPESLTRIEGWSFNKCTALSNISFPPRLTFIGSQAFVDCKGIAGELIIPDAVTAIEEWAFGGSNVTKLVFGNGISSIPSFVGAWCVNLKEIEIPANVTTIGQEAFANSSLDVIRCDAITPPTAETNSFPESAYTGTLYVCSPDEVSEYKSASVWDNFTDITVLPIFDYIAIPDSDEATLSLKPGLKLPFKVYIPFEVDIEGDSYTINTLPEGLLQNRQEIHTVSLSEGLTSIGWNVFSGCDNLTNVSLPTSLRSLEGGCFSACKELQHIDLPENIEKIGPWTFSDCVKLNSDSEFIVPDAVTSLGDHAFWGTRMSRLVIGAGVTQIPSDFCNWSVNLKNVHIRSNNLSSIGENAFANTSITDMNCETSIPPTISENSLPNSIATATLEVPTSADVEAYKNADVWKNFATIKASNISTGIDNINLNIQQVSTVYDLRGTKVADSIEDVHNSGIYIINGEKIFIK